MQALKLPSGAYMPKYGMGNLAYGRARRCTCARGDGAGLDAGVRLIDSAEKVAAVALEGRRDEAFVVSKVLPSNASRRGVRAACETLLKCLGTDRIDLYLLHWPGSTPMEETCDARGGSFRGACNGAFMCRRTRHSRLPIVIFSIIACLLMSRGAMQQHLHKLRWLGFIRSPGSCRFRTRRM
jgi:diketogulonate reductase-like aldo/keto reductase